MATKKTRRTATSTDDDPAAGGSQSEDPSVRRASLTSLLGTILRELNTLTPPDVVIVPMALSVPLAALLQEHIRGKELELFSPDVHNYYLSHGFYHAALEGDPPQPALARRIARVILQSADPLTYQRFLTNHPEATNDAAPPHKEPRA